TCKTLEKALKVKGRKEGLMLHSDQGWHYRTPMWRSMLVEAGICNERCNSDPHPTPEIRSRG
ncbi:hypothetical protein, partial [Yersinia pestis]